ncbi:hypothetical protein LCL96_06400 [Rossellomorea aquimaris]|uniref:hypothetical protein n=1 Tax=Rossellomorea aquimaris TaxID=189382 RepID=UPI001CD2805C|nr:hypothetical protein [Rossellomorea aquimaris]MCA1058557.1 hypothetical protein [Rossellomorea aquimaris]
MTLLIVIVSFFILLILAEEMVYYFLRSKIMDDPSKRDKNEGKMKEWYYKVKLKLHHPQ